MFEIERKFLVDIVDFNTLNLKNGEFISQGYLQNEPSRSLRIRIKGDKAFLTIKIGERAIKRLEYEYEIPINDGNELLKQCVITLEKIRYTLEYQGKVWEIDKFLGKNEGLILAEIELEDELDVFTKPEWLGLEVTEDSRYLNVNLIHARP